MDALKYFDGNFSDYMPDWYQRVGSKIVFTQIVNTVMPFINMFIIVIKKKVNIYMDSGSDIYNTKCTSMAHFKTIYGGQEYFIYVKFASLLTVVFVTMMYGLAIPILFPIAVFHFISFYLCERIMLAYLYR